MSSNFSTITGGVREIHRETKSRTDGDVVKGVLVAGAGFGVNMATTPAQGVPVMEALPAAVETVGESAAIGLGFGYLLARFTKMPIGAVRAAGAALAASTKYLAEIKTIPTTPAEIVPALAELVLAGAGGYGGTAAITNAPPKR